MDYLCKQKKGPILVVDADANSNLNEVLGVEVETTLGDIREQMARAEMNGGIPGGMTKADYAEMMFGTALCEEDDFDMLVMGRTQGKGCYCFVNGVLKTQIDKYAGNYKYMVKMCIRDRLGIARVVQLLQKRQHRRAEHTHRADCLLYTSRCV